MGSYVVTGGGRGVGRAISERLLRDGGHVVVVEFDGSAVEWVAEQPRAAAVVGDAAAPEVAEAAAARAESAAPLTGWVNNAAVFRDASLHDSAPGDVLELVNRNLAPAITGSATAVRRFLAAGSGGALVNISSHQATRAVRGCAPYVMAKAAVEGLTRAMAVEYGDRGVRVNTVALGSVRTERYDALLAGLDEPAARRVEDEMRRLHPLGRVGEASEVAATVAFLLSAESSFISGALVPVDGGRLALGGDPEAH